MMQRMKWEAGLRGIDLDKQTKKQKRNEGMEFKDQQDYQDLTPEERQRETKKMMEAHKGLFRFPKGG